MSRLSMKDGRIVIGEQDEKPKNTTQKTNTSNSRLSMVDGRIVLADKPAANKANNQSYLQKTQAAQREYQAMDDMLPQRRTSNVMDMAIDSLRNRVANSTIGRAANEWASRVSGNVQNVLNESPEYRAAKRQARADNEARRQQFAIDTANLIDQASAQYEGPTRVERFKTDLKLNDMDDAQEHEFERTVRNERYNPLSREERDALINRYADAVNGKTDANTYQQTLYDVTKNGGIEQLYREQQADAANDRDYSRILNGNDVSDMTRGERFLGSWGNFAAGTGEQIATSGIGLYASNMNTAALNAANDDSPASYRNALDKAVTNWYYGLVNGADDPGMEENIRRMAAYVGGDSYADAVIQKVRERAEEDIQSGGEMGFSSSMLDEIESDNSALWRNLQGTIEESGVYDALDQMQTSSQKHIQRAKDINNLQDLVGGNVMDTVVEGGVSTAQNMFDAGLAATLGLSGAGAIAMIPFALRAYGGSYAEQINQARELGQMISQDVARNATRNATASAAIEVGTELMWGMVGAMSKVTGGGALDDAAQQKLAEAIAGLKMSESGIKTLQRIGEKALGGFTEGLEEVIGDAATRLLTNMGVMTGELTDYSEWVKEVGHSFVLGALGGLMGEVTGLVSTPMQQSKIGKQLKAGGITLNDGTTITVDDMVNLANSPGMEGTTLEKTYSSLLDGTPRATDSFSDRELGKLYEAYEETMGRSRDAVDRVYDTAEKVQAGEELSRAEVNRITNNPDAVRYLQGVVGEDVGFNGSITDRKAAVEMALRTLANENETLSGLYDGIVNLGPEDANTAELQRQADEISSGRIALPGTIAEDYFANSTQQAVRDAAQRAGVDESGQNILANVYTGARENAEQAVESYQQGRTGGEYDIEKHSAPEYEIGRQEYRNELAVEENNNGRTEELRVRSGLQGDDSQSAGGQTQGVEESSGSVELREGTAGFERSKGVSGVYSQPVSAASLGIRGGSNNANIRVLTQTNDKSVQNAKQLIESRGYNAVLFAGGALEINGEQARGYYDPETNTIYVRADHRLFTAEQIARHEVMHDRIRKGEVDLAAVRDDMIKRLGGTERFERTMRDYMALYEKTGMSFEQVFEEAVCDAAGDMNEFLYHGHWNDANAAVSFYKTAKESAKATEKEGGEQKAAEKKMSREVPVGAYLPRTSSEERSRYDGSDSAYGIDPNGRKYSLDSLGKDIVDKKFQSDLVNKLGMKIADVDKLVASLNDLMEYIKPNRDILDLNETYTKETRPYSPYKPNSDPLYKISLDYSTLCRKRLMTQYIIEKLQLREHRPMSGEEQIAIRDMLKEYRQIESGLQVACAMCYVEAARLKSPDQMNRYFDDPTPVLKNFFAQKNKAYKRKVESLQKKWKTDHGYDANDTKKEMTPADVSAFNEYSSKIRHDYDPATDQADAKRRKEELDAIERANELSPDNYLSAANLADLKEKDRLIYDAYTSNIRAATRSKGLETDVPYYYGDSRKKGGPSDKFIKNVNAENGMRFSSWSDFQFVHLLDQMMATIDLSVRKAAMHGYTKFPEQVRIFGKTGAMFNMSGVSGGTGFNTDGSLYFSQTESIDFEEAKRLREEFPETAGLQCIGINDKHVRALLQSDFIDYVIPYHVSGMNAALRNMAKISSWKDYTSTQEESAIDSKAKWEDSEKKCAKEKWHKAPVFSEFFDKAWYTDPAYKGKGVEAMREATKRYVQMCADRGMRPKFPQFLNEANYWKLLIDRKMVNQKTGDLIQQKPVMPNFDFDVIKKEIDTYVSNTRATQGIEDRALKYITDRWDQLPGRIAALKQEGAVEKTLAEVEHRANTLGNEMYAAAPKNVAAYKYSRDIEYAKQIDLAISGKMDRNNSVFVADTPNVLRKIGLNNYPILMTQRHVRNVLAPKDTTKHQHGITETQLKSVNKEIQDPIMVIESKTPGDIIVLTSMKDPDGSPVILTIHPDGFGRYNGITVKSNFGTSLYGRDGFNYFLKDAIRDNRILYNNSKRIQSLAREARVSFSGALTKDGFFENNIAQFRSHRQEDLSDSEKESQTKRKTFNTVEELYAAATPVQEQLNKMLRQISNEFGFSYNDVTQKSLSSIKKKVKRKLDVGKKYSMMDMKDHTRSAVMMNDWKNIPKVLDAFDDRGIPYATEAVVNDWGYKGFHVTWKNEDGITSEVQLTTSKHWPLKLWSDSIYDKWRDVTNVDDLSPEERARYKADFEESRDRWAQFEMPDLRPYERKSSSESGRAFQWSSKDTGLTASVQAPSTSSRTLPPSKNGPKSSTLPSSVTQKSDIAESPLSGDFDRYTQSKNNISEKGSEVKHSRDLDSDGNKLSEQQAEYFKDSKVRDSDGNLLVMYHGTADTSGFTVFDSGKISRVMIGSGFYFTPRESTAKSFGKGRVYKAYLNITNPVNLDDLPDDIKEMARDFYGKKYDNESASSWWGSFQKRGEYIDDQIEKRGIDILRDLVGTNADWSELEPSERLEYGEKITNLLKSYRYDGVIWRDMYVAFYPDQIKNTDNLNPTSNPDIRYSRDLSNTELYEANRQLQKDLTELRSKLKTRTEQYKHWKGQTKVTEGRQLRTEDVTKLAREIIKGQESSADAKAVAEKMKALGEYLLNSQDENVYDEARLKAYEVAHDILANAKALNTKGGDDFYSDFRTALKNQPIYVAPSVREEVAPDGWNDFRKAQYGTVNMTADQNKGKSVDKVYHDLQATFGEWLLPEYITSEADQLNKILEIIETYRPVYENMNSYEMADAVEWTANEILTRIIGEEIRETNPTYADRMEKKLADQKAKAQTALKRVRQQRDRKVADLKAHYQQVAEDRRNRKIDSEMRSRLLAVAKRLNNKKLPRAQRALLDQYIGELDLVSKGLTGRTIRDLEYLRDFYEAYKKRMGNDFTPDPFIQGKIDRLYKKHISDMTQEEVADLTTVLLSLEKELWNENRLINSEIRQDLYAAGMQTIDDIDNSNGKDDFFSKYIGAETASPERYIHRITGYRENSPLYQAVKELSAGQRKMLDYQRRAEALFKKWTTDKKFIRRIAGKHAEEITISGKVNGEMTDVKITPAMRMALYLHGQNDDNMRHIAQGGVTIPDITLYKQGKLEKAYEKGVEVILTRSQLLEIVSHMSDEERAFANAISKYYNGMSRDSINDVSEDLKGYAIAGVEYYYPIDTNKAFLAKEFDSLKRDGTLEGMGFLKDRQANAATPIMLYDANDTLNRSIQQHSRYYGLAIPVRNMNRLYGVTTFRDKELTEQSNAAFERTWEFNSSVQKALQRSWGNTATKYIGKMLTDIQNGTGLDSDAWGDLLARARSKYAGAVLNTNASVAIKQAASYPTAAAVVGYGPLMKALADVKKIDLDKLAQYTPLLWYRSKGFSTTELGDIGKEGRHIPKALNWIQAMDVATTTKLAKAAMYYVNENNKDLTRGTDAWWKAVAEVYNRIIEETQPNYTMMQRPQILRSDNALTRALNMFKTQPFQNFNILYDAFGNLAAKSREYKANATEENLQALKSARTNVARAVSSQAVSAFIFALMQFAWDAFRGKAKKYKDDDDEMTLASWLKGMGINVLSSAGGMIPFGSYALELGETMTDAILKAFKLDPFFDQTFYGLSENASSSVNDMGKAMINMVTKISQTLSGGEVTESTVRSVVDSMGDIAQFAGIPVNNVIKLAQSIGRNIYLATEGKYVGGYHALRLTTDPARYSSDYYDLLWKAYNNDKAAYDEVLQMMLDDGFAEEKIKSAMEKRMKDAQGVGNVKDLESRWMAPSQQKTYDEGLADLEKTTMFQAATDEQQKALLTKLYNLALDNDAGKKLNEKIAGGADVGLEQNEYLLYTLALSMVDEPTESGKYGSYTNDEVEAAILMVPGLSKEERAYLWDAAGKAAKSNPWR